MKITASLLFALGFVSQAAFAQLYPAAPEDSHMQPGTGMQLPPEHSSEGASGNATSGSSGKSPSSGASTSAPAASGTSDATNNASSGGATGMQSEAGAELRPAPPLANPLQPQVAGDITYVCGGVGKEEAAYMKKQAHAHAYDLLLTFAARNGEYLADVNVDIKDAKGNDVLQAKCDAPMMLIDMPRSGTYRVHADAAGYTQNHTVTVRAGKTKAPHLASVVLAWPQRVAQAPAASPATSTGSSGGESRGESDAGTGGSTSTPSK